MKKYKKPAPRRGCRTPNPSLICSGIHHVCSTLGGDMAAADPRDPDLLLLFFFFFNISADFLANPSVICARVVTPTALRRTLCGRPRGAFAASSNWL